MIVLPWSQQPGGPVRIDRSHPLGAALDYLWVCRDNGGVDLVRGLPAPLASNTLVSTRLGRAVANTSNTGTVVAFQGGNRLPYIQVGLGYFTTAGGNWALSQLTNASGGYVARLTLSSSSAVALQVQHAFGTTRTISISPGSGSSLSPNLFLMVSQVFSGTDYHLYADGQQASGTLDAGTFSSMDRLQPIGGNLNGGLLLSGFGFGRVLPHELLRDFTKNPSNAWKLLAPQRRYWMLGVSSGGVSGTLATTNADDTSSASGTTTVLGTLVRTNADDSSSASGTTTVLGTLARTNANDTSAASGTTTVLGTSATTNADDTSDASGTVGSEGSTGTLATTNANDTSSAAGTTTVVGSLARTNANDAISASGWAGVVSGTSDTANANDTIAAFGVAVGQAAGGGGYVKPEKARRYGLLPPKTKEELAELVRAQREALGIIPKQAQKRIVKAAKKAASKPDGLQLLAPLVVDVAVSAEVPAIDVARAVEQSFAYAVALQQAKATIDAGIRQQAEQERQAKFEAARQEHLNRLRAEDENVLAFMESLRNEAIQAIRATQQQLKELLSSGIAAPE